MDLQKGVWIVKKKISSFVWSPDRGPDVSLNND